MSKANRELFRNVVHAWLTEHHAVLAEENRFNSKRGLHENVPVDGEWWLATIYGTLWLKVDTTFSATVYARFLSPALAKGRLTDLNFTLYTGKWNHHFDDLDVQPTPNSDHYWCPAWVALKLALEKVAIPQKEGP